MRCRLVKKNLPLLVGGELSDGASRRLRGHLRSCGECRQELLEYKSALDAVRGLAREEETRDWNAAEWASLMNRVTMAKPTLDFLSWKRPVKLTAVCSIALIIFAAAAFLFFRGHLVRQEAAVFFSEKIVFTRMENARELKADQWPVEKMDIPEPFLTLARRQEKLRDVDSQQVESSPDQDVQDSLAVTLVSQETGLRIYWYFNKKFDWKEDE